LAGADGLNNSQISRKVGLCPHTVGRLRKRFHETRLRGIFDLPRSGAPRTISDEQVAEVIPTHSSWLNQVERFFAKITLEQIRRGSFRSVNQLRNCILDYIKQHNQNSKPFRWTASAELILGKVEYLCKSLR